MIKSHGLKTDGIAAEIIENDLKNFQESFEYATWKEQSVLTKKTQAEDVTERRAVLEGFGSSTNGT